MKLETMTEQEIDSIAEAFADYQYENGEDGLFYLFPHKEAVRAYMRAFVRAGLKAGWLYTTSEKREGYIMISDSRSGPPVSALAEVIRGCIKSLGLKRSLVFRRAIKSGGMSLEDRMKKAKHEFIKIELLVVTKPYQGQGYMRKVADIAFQMAQEKNLPCILDTDGRLKRDKYIHLGMQAAGERKIGEQSYLYDLIRPVNSKEESTTEVIVTKNGKEVGHFIPKDATVSYLTDSLTGILKGDYEIEQAREESGIFEKRKVMALTPKEFIAGI